MVLLDENYFEPLNIPSDGSCDKELLAFRLKRPAIVLCNEETGQALASFMWQAHNEYVERPHIQQPREESFAKTALIERARGADGDQIFHGIVDKNRQFCDFLLTNLTGVCGRPTEHAPHLIIALKNSRAGAHDQVNYVNVFAPGQTYKVYADMSRGSQKIILDAIVRTESDPVNLRPVQHALSVGKDDAEVASGVKADAEGIHYALRVLPELGHKRTAELFGKGVKLIWRVQDVVLLFVPRLPTFIPQRRMMDRALSLTGLANFNRKEVTSSDQEGSSSLTSEMQCGMLERRGPPTHDAPVDCSLKAMPCLLEPDHGSPSLKSQPVQNLSNGFADVLSSVHELSSRVIPWGKSTTEVASCSKMSTKFKKASRGSCDEESSAMELQLQACAFVKKAAPAPQAAPSPPLWSASERMSLRGLANFNRKEVTSSDQEGSSSLTSEMQCDMLARGGPPTAEMPAKCKRASRGSCNEESPAMELQLQAGMFRSKAARAAPEPVMLQRCASPAPPPPAESACKMMHASMATRNDESSVSAMLCRREPNYEASILNSQAGQMLSGGFAEVIGTASEQTFDLDLSAPVCIIGLSVAVEEQMNMAVSWFLRSAGAVETSLRLQCGLQFEQKIEEAYQQWISSDSSVQFRLFRFHDPTGNNWHIIDLSSMTGTQAPAVEVLGRNFIDPQLVVFTELRRESALQKGGDLALLFANSIRPLDDCVRSAQAALYQYTTNCKI